MKTYATPKHYDASQNKDVYRVPYAQLAQDATAYKLAHQITHAATDKLKIGVMMIDVQNTFCIPDYELFVSGAPDDSSRLTEFIYGNLGRITKIFPTMDTHTHMQIFHPSFFVNDAGEHPAPMTMITANDLSTGVWKVNPAVASNFNTSYTALTKHVISYCQKLEAKDKYALTIWPYHAMLGGTGHALVSIVEEATFFHGQVRGTEPGIEIKGGNPLTENYSVLSPEVLTDADGNAIAQKNTRFIEKLLKYDMLIIAGQAKSHCLAWTVEDLLTEIAATDPDLAKKVYLLEDCTSPVIVPGIVDYTDDANKAFDRFAHAGMHIVKSTDPIDTWPGVNTDKLA